MQSIFDDHEFRNAVLAVVNAANDAGRDARRYGYDKSTQNRCQEVFRLARTVSKVVITATDLSLPEVQRAVMSLKAGHIRPLPEDPRQLKLF